MKSSVNFGEISILVLVPTEIRLICMRLDECPRNKTIIIFVRSIHQVPGALWFFSTIIIIKKLHNNVVFWFLIRSLQMHTHWSTLYYSESHSHIMTSIFNSFVEAQEMCNRDCFPIKTSQIFPHLSYRVDPYCHS